MLVPHFPFQILLLTFYSGIFLFSFIYWKIYPSQAFFDTKCMHLFAFQIKNPKAKTAVFSFLNIYSLWFIQINLNLFLFDFSRFLLQFKVNRNAFIHQLAIPWPFLLVICEGISCLLYLENAGDYFLEIIWKIFYFSLT